MPVCERRWAEIREAMNPWRWYRTQPKFTDPRRDVYERFVRGEELTPEEVATARAYWMEHIQYKDADAGVFS